MNITISTANSRFSKNWRPKVVAWEAFVSKCASPVKTAESVAEYRALDKETQTKIKDVGGFVGGVVKNGQRKTDNVTSRTLITLDVDFATGDFWEIFKKAFPNTAAVAYSTHKSTEELPRLRLIIPLSKEINPDIYEPIARMVASKIGMMYFDDTTYQVARLFYWGSHSQDAKYIFHEQQGEPLNPEDIIKEYTDINNTAEWPTSERETKVIHKQVKQQEDPTQKSGVIGAFCRAYTIEEAIEEYLPDTYEKTAHEGRYTYKAGSVAAGLVCYDHKFAYSNHATDPTSGTLCNAFDLVRMHKYPESSGGKKASMDNMQELALKDQNVKKQLAADVYRAAQSDFQGLEASEASSSSLSSPSSPSSPSSLSSFLEDLDYTKQGNIKPTFANIKTILNQDINLKDKLYIDLFSNRMAVCGGLPWDKKANFWQDKDDSELRGYLETKYNISNQTKIQDALISTFNQNAKHPIRDYLGSLTWDGTPRLERLIIDYVGAEDTEIYRTFTRKFFTAAVARVFQPGIKFDHCLVLAGDEGIGKSTLFATMGSKWFSDSLVTLEGKDAMEQVEGNWIIEMSELSSMRKAEATTIKQFLSKTEDKYRKAYGRHKTIAPRQCVFCGTTNEEFFLKGNNGNRRFWVIPVSKKQKAFSNWFQKMKQDRDQLWAEAYHYYKQGETLYLSPEDEQQARDLQKLHSEAEDDNMREAVQIYLDTPLPPNWTLYSEARRQAFYHSGDPLDPECNIKRTKVCAMGFCIEYLGEKIGSPSFTRSKARFTQIMKEMENWEYGVIKTDFYKAQRGFLYVGKEEKEDDL